MSRVYLKFISQNISQTFWGIACLPSSTHELLGILWGYYHILSLGVGFKHFLFHPYLGKITILTSIFQRG